MGKLALAAKITHVPSMYLSEFPGPNFGPQLMWYSLFTCQCTSNTTMVSTPSARQRRSISLCPAMAASRQPKFGPGNSDKYIEGTCVILAASASLPMTRAFVAVGKSHRLLG